MFLNLGYAYLYRSAEIHQGPQRASGILIIQHPECGDVVLLDSTFEFTERQDITGNLERGEAHLDTLKSLEDVYDHHIAFRYTL